MQRMGWRSYGCDRRRGFTSVSERPATEYVSDRLMTLRSLVDAFQNTFMRDLQGERGEKRKTQNIEVREPSRYRPRLAKLQP